MAAETISREEDSGVALRRGVDTRAVIPYGLAMVTVVLLYWSIDIVSPALPEIRDDVGMTAAGAGLVFSTMFLGRLIGNLPATWFLEQKGAVWTALLGSTVLLAGSLIVAVAPGSVSIYMGRTVQGVGIALAINAALRSILRLRPAEGAAMTWFGLAATTGGILGLASSGVLTESFGWRSVFAMSAGLALGAAVLTLSVLVPRRPSPGIAATAPAKAEVAANQVAVSKLMIPVGVNLVVFANYSIWVALPLYAQNRFDASASQTATLLMIIMVVHLLAALPIGGFIRRTGSANVLVAGIGIALIGTILVPVAPSLIWLAPPLVLYGVGQVAAVNAGGDIVLRRGDGTNRAIGLLRLSSDLGLVVGPIAAGVVADRFGMRAPFLILPILMLVACFVAQSAFSRGAAGNGGVREGMIDE